MANSNGSDPQNSGGLVVRVRRTFIEAALSEEQDDDGSPTAEATAARLRGLRSCPEHVLAQALRVSEDALPAKTSTIRPPLSGTSGAPRSSDMQIAMLPNKPPCCTIVISVKNTFLDFAECLGTDTDHMEAGAKSVDGQLAAHRRFELRSWPLLSPEPEETLLDGMEEEDWPGSYAVDDTDSEAQLHLGPTMLAAGAWPIGYPMESIPSASQPLSPLLPSPCAPAVPLGSPGRLVHGDNTTARCFASGDVGVNDHFKEGVDAIELASPPDASHNGSPGRQLHEMCQAHDGTAHPAAGAEEDDFSYESFQSEEKSIHNPGLCWARAVETASSPRACSAGVASLMSEEGVVVKPVVAPVSDSGLAPVLSENKLRSCKKCKRGRGRAKVSASSAAVASQVASWPVVAAKSANVSADPAGCRSHGHSATPRLYCHFYLNPGILADGFPLVKQLIGTSGKNTKSIHEETGAKIRVRGQGSGHEERGGKEARVPLMIAITGEHRRPCEFRTAVEKIKELTLRVMGRFEDRCRERNGHAHLRPLFWTGEASQEAMECLGNALDGVPPAPTRNAAVGLIN